MQPPLVLAPIPDPILRPEHPPSPLAIEHGQVADGDPESTRRQVPRASFIDEEFVLDLSFGERIDSHRGDYAPTRRSGWEEPGTGECRIPFKLWLPACVAPHPEAHATPLTADAALLRVHGPPAAGRAHHARASVRGRYARSQASS